MRLPSCHRQVWGLGLLLAATYGCGGTDLECGPTTVEKDGKCVPRITQCAPGTVPDGAECVPACSSGEHWDGTQCVASTTCGDGTQLQGGECVSVCESGQYWDGTTCRPVPTCEPGTSFNESSGQCEPNEEVCAPGSSWINGACVPDLQCGSGTHAQGGACVPDGLPDPDVVESAEPDGAAGFTVPDDGDTIVLGGVIDVPEATNHPDWDRFTFTAEAGTYLQIEGYSDGVLRPAFLVESLAHNTDGSPRYVRYALAGDGLLSRREVYLPFAGEYELRITDHDHLVATVFSSAGALPVGGSEFGYAVEVQNLGAPDAKPVSSLPATETGDLGDGALWFYSFTGLDSGDFVGAKSAGVVPPDTDSDVFHGLVAVSSSGDVVRERISYQTYGDVEILVGGGWFRQPHGGSGSSAFDWRPRIVFSRPVRGRRRGLHEWWV